MEIASPEAHRALVYVNAVNSHGYELSVRELVAYMAAPEPMVTGGLGQFVTASLYQALEGAFATKKESLPEWLSRLGWLSTEGSAGSVVRVTELGRAVLLHLNDSELQSDTTLSIVLDPDDPFSYARVIGTIASHDDALLVDPYLRLDQLPHILYQTSITRILTSTAISKQDRAGLAVALSTHNLDRDFDIRAADRNAVHDRYVIPPSGPIQMLGTSLSGVGKRPSALVTLTTPADSIREMHERIWDESPSLRPAEPAVEDGDESDEDQK
jgi:hypothetical protein